MKTIILISAIVLLLIFSISLTGLAASEDIICKPTIMTYWVCMDTHVFSSYSAMHNYYTVIIEPVMIEKLPAYTFVTGGTTETFSGE